MLGASNLTHCFPHVVSGLRARLQGPIDVLAAIGDGRSYGRLSHFLARELPGILECGLWPALEGRPKAELSALVGDLGNDLVYGAEVQEIAEWLERILDRLQERGGRCTLVRLPLSNLDRISRLRFTLARSLFYPGRRISLDELRARALELDARMETIAEQRRIALVAQRADWYGIDPIHVLRRRRVEACSTWLDPFGKPAAAGANGLPRADRAALHRMRAERRWLFGKLQVRAQPSARLLDGTTISVY